MKNKGWRCRTRSASHWSEGGAHRPHRQLLIVLGAQPHLRDGGVYRSRQPAADLPGRHRGRALRLARLRYRSIPEGQQPDRNAQWRDAQPAFRDPLRCARAKRPIPTARRSAAGRSWRLSMHGNEIQRKEIVVNDPLVYQRRSLLPIELRTHWQSSTADSHRSSSEWIRSGRARSPWQSVRALALDADTTRSTRRVHSRLRCAGWPCVYAQQRHDESCRAFDRHFEEVETQPSTSGCRKFPVSPKTRNPPTYSIRKI